MKLFHLQLYHCSPFFNLNCAPSERMRGRKGASLGNFAPVYYDHCKLYTFPFAVVVNPWDRKQSLVSPVSTRRLWSCYKRLHQETKLSLLRRGLRQPLWTYIDGAFDWGHRSETLTNRKLPFSYNIVIPQTKGSGDAKLLLLTWFVSGMKTDELVMHHITRQGRIIYSRYFNSVFEAMTPLKSLINSATDLSPFEWAALNDLWDYAKLNQLITRGKQQFGACSLPSCFSAIFQFLQIKLHLCHFIFVAN